MKRIVTCAVVAVVLLVMLLGTGSPAQAGTATDVVLGLASFAVFNQVVGAFARPYYPPPIYAAPVVVAPAPVVYRPAPVYVSLPAPVYVAPAPPHPTVVQYPHGRYELRHRAHHYVWVWIPTLHVPPPPPAAFAPSPAGY